jgi:N-acetylmuramoyl-L-alanine amidase
MVNRFSITATIVMLIVATFFSMIRYEEPLVLKPNYNRLTADAQKQVQCLAKNIYFEARNEPVEGQKAVAFVTLNRVKSEEFPDTICDVVKQKTRVTSIGDRKIVCQFSWYCESKPKWQYYKYVLTNRTTLKYNEVLEVAIYVYANRERIYDPTNGSLFYHADYVRPNWRNFEKQVVIGRHIFYKVRNNI